MKVWIRTTKTTISLLINDNNYSYRLSSYRIFWSKSFACRWSDFHVDASFSSFSNVIRIVSSWALKKAFWIGPYSSLIHKQSCFATSSFFWMDNRKAVVVHVYMCHYVRKDDRSQYVTWLTKEMESDACSFLYSTSILWRGVLFMSTMIDNRWQLGNTYMIFDPLSYQW